MIRPSELKEIRQLAIDGATKRYVLSDASIESEYQAGLARYLKEKDKAKGKHDRINWDALAADVSQEMYGRTPAVALVRGVQLNPSTPSLCFVNFDFEPSRNPHARLPDGQVRAERFERSDGSHYWVIDW